MVVLQVALPQNLFMNNGDSIHIQKKFEALKNTDSKTILICFSILLFRALDLFTTHLATSIDFSKQEQNFLVKKFNFSKIEFFISESIFAIFIVLLYLLSKKKNISFLRANSLAGFYNINFNISNFISSFKKLIFIFFSIIPQLYITTSCILAINNFTVYLYHKNNSHTVKYYRLLDEYHIIDFILFVFPIILLCYFMHLKIKSHYKVLHK